MRPVTLPSATGRRRTRSSLRTILPEDCIGDQGRDAHESNLRDVHRRYAEVTTSDAVIAYFQRLRQLSPA